jgi:hypothetical protein
MAIPVLSPLSGQVAGTGKVQLTDGSGINTHIAVFDAAGTLVDGGPVPSGGGSLVSYDCGNSATSGSSYVIELDMGASA